MYNIKIKWLLVHPQKFEFLLKDFIQVNKYSNFRCLSDNILAKFKDTIPFALNLISGFSRMDDLFANSS